MNRPKSFRLTLAIGLYLLLVLLAAFVFSWVRRGVTGESPVRYAYILFGPALSLFTHMSYLLFALQSLLLIPWIVGGVLNPKWRRLAVAGFCICWLGIGWYMYDLF
jgi:hypothetical protein